jgi:hypothetical protein
MNNVIKLRILFLSKKKLRILVLFLNNLEQCLVKINNLEEIKSQTLQLKRKKQKVAGLTAFQSKKNSHSVKITVQCSF